MASLDPPRPCEHCSAPAQLQCGYCEDLQFCERAECFEALHPRTRNWEMHRASSTAYGTARCSDLAIVDPKHSSLYLQAEVATVTAIGGSLLSGYTTLTALDLSAFNSVSEIGNCFLQGCGALKTLNLSGLTRATSIGDHFLEECRSLTELNLAGLSRVTSVGHRFLAECTALRMIDLSALSGVTNIGDDFLHGCTSLRSVDISGLSAVEEMGPGCLGYCEELKSLEGQDRCSHVVVARLPAV